MQSEDVEENQFPVGRAAMRNWTDPPVSTHSLVQDLLFEGRWIAPCNCGTHFNPNGSFRFESSDRSDPMVKKSAPFFWIALIFTCFMPTASGQNGVDLGTNAMMINRTKVFDTRYYSRWERQCSIYDDAPRSRSNTHCSAKGCCAFP